MRLMRLTVDGVTRFMDRVVLDLDTLGEGLVAIVGPNGSGKTTLMEGVAAALYRRLPSRPGPLVDHVNSKTGLVIAEFSDSVAGRVLRVAQNIDGVRRSTEGNVFVQQGQTWVALTDGKRASFDAFIERTFGDEALFLASVFATQNRGGNLLDATPGERKEVMASLLGLDEMTRISEAAKARYQEALRVRDTSVAALDALTAGTAENIAMLRNTLASQAAQVVSLQGQREVYGVQMAALEEQLAAARQTNEAISRAEVVVATCERNLAMAKARLERAEAAKAASDARLESVRAAQKYDEQHHRDQAKSRFALSMRAIDAQRAQLMERIEAANALRPDEQLVAQIQRIDGLAQGAREAADEKAKASAKLHAKELEWSKTVREWEVAEKVAEERIALWRNRAEIATGAPCVGRKWMAADGVERNLEAECQFLASAVEAKTSLAELVRFRETSKQVQEQQTAEHDDEMRRLRAAVDAMASRYDALVAESIGSQGLLVQLREQRRQHDAARTAAADLARLKDQQRAFEERLEADLRGIDAEMATIAETLRKAEQAHTLEEPLLRAELHAASTEVVTQQEALARGQGELSVARQKRIDLDPLMAQLRSATAQREEMQNKIHAAAQTLATTQAALDLANEAAERREALEVSLKQVDLTIAANAIIQRVFGKTGIQAMEIDAAGPEISEITNSLLAECYGPRWSVTFETQRLRKDGDGYIEVFDLIVYDGLVRRPIEALSGGEKIIVGEAISLALAIYNAMKSGIRWKTLWRDETAGALDPDNANAYVAMLRKARKIGWFDQIVFVAHQEAVWSAADAVVTINANGSLTSNA